MVYELAKVTATFYQPGDDLSYSTLLGAENDCWFYEDDDTDVLWDALSDPEIKGGYGMFEMHAIRFQFEFHAGPDWYDHKTALEWEIEGSGIDDVVGKDTVDFEPLVDIACKHFMGFKRANPVIFFVAYVYTSHRCGDDDTCPEWYMLGEVDFNRLPLTAPPSKLNRPKIVCLCGSTRFSDAYQKANFDETLAGNIVLTIGCDMKSDNELFANMTEQERYRVKCELDALHREKIELADEIFVLNVGDYIGQSTKIEIWHAKGLGKTIRYLEPHKESETE